MGRSRRKLFISATVSGFALRLGLPGLADLISLIWDTTRGPLASLTPSGLEIIISLVSLAVFAIVTYLTWEMNRPGEAARLLEEAVALLPSHALPQMLLGVAYFEQGKLREAREAFRKTLRLPQDQDNEVCVRCWIAKINEQIGND